LQKITEKGQQTTQKDRVTLQPNGTPGHSCAGQQSRFVECLEILDCRLRGSDPIEALSGENQRGPPFG